MFKKAISRRAMIRGTAAVMALPWLEAMQPACLRAPAKSAGPARALFIFSPNGKHMEAWKPKEKGRRFPLTPTLQALEPVRKSVTVISGLALDGGRDHGDGAGDHARAAASFLTCAHPKKTGGQDIEVGVSIDQILAKELGAATKFPSLELGCEPGRAAGICDSGYSCAYSNNISWRTSSLPMPKETKPRAIFNRLFGITDGSRDLALEARISAEKRSILDCVGEDANALKEKLGLRDRAKLDDYMSAVRELEKRVSLPIGTAPPPDFVMPSGSIGGYPEQVALLYDLIALAFQTDATRIATFMLGNAGSNRSYSFLGCPDGHHDTSHHGKDPKKHEALAKINAWHVERFASFLKKMATVEEGDSTLLDLSFIVYGSGLSDGDRHNHDDLPVLLAGHGRGTLHPGQHLAFSKETPMANLYLSILSSMGVRADRFGDSTGRLEGI